ncbi:hypothetical protein FTX61_03730 [Nitriliruptoraceae bacterium ZYF776]|nr:hypothetical protein [Profundirhabdus halotolerans]
MHGDLVSRGPRRRGVQGSCGRGVSTRRCALVAPRRRDRGCGLNRCAADGPSPFPEVSRRGTADVSRQTPPYRTGEVVTFRPATAVADLGWSHPPRRTLGGGPWSSVTSACWATRC